MSDHLTLDVIDRPAGGVVHAMRSLRATRVSGAPGLRALLRFGTGHFSPRPYPRPTLRRVGVIAVWESSDATEGWDAALSPVVHGAREHWHLGGELVRAAFSEPWHGWTPDTKDAVQLDGDEPALVIISGQLKPKFFPAFMRDGSKAVRQAHTQPGYLGGLAINASLLNTTSCSAWRTYEHARAYAFQPGAHADAMRRDRAAGRHSTEWFLRIRPLVEWGTLAGHALFTDLENEKSGPPTARSLLLGAYPSTAPWK